jgi:hypothetical protein
MFSAQIPIAHGVREAIPMAGEQFFVVLHEGRWTIKHKGMYLKPYDTKFEAIKSAVDQANEANKKGALASVSVQSSNVLSK